MEYNSPKPLHILLVEDSEEDAFLFRRGLDSTRLQAGLTHVLDGADAINYLRAAPPYSDRTKYPFPGIIMTDLNMPRSDGFELLQWIKEHPSCAVIPTIVLSSSFLEGDIAQAYVLGANAFLVKPQSIRELADLLLVTYMFWSKCQRPTPPSGLKCE